MSRVEYILGLWQPPSGHSVGINTIQKGSECVLSGGRDGRVCGWLPNRADPVIQYEAHTDWVNGLLETNSQIWSCSNDTTVKCYSNQQLTTIGAHRDYVKCLASSNENGRIYSAGLDGQVIAWTPEGHKEFSVSVEGEMGSIYSLAAQNNTFVTGGPDSVVRVWDARQPEEARKFLGHSDNVRALLMNDEWIVSGSSDATVSLWNLRTGRLFRSWTSYTDSVFSLYSGDGLKSWYSGDRQGKIHWTSREGHNVLVAEQADPVQGIVEHNGIWSGALSLKYWEDVQGDQNASCSSPRSSPGDAAPSMVVEPHVSLAKTQMLNDKRRVLVAATDGSAALIDVIRGEVIERIPNVDVEDIAQGLLDIADQYNTQDVLDNWCQVGIRAGHLVVNLEERSAGSTEVYGDELGPAMGLDLGVSNNDDYRINLGKWVLQALFANFVHAESPRLDELRTKAQQEQQAAAAQQAAEVAERPKKERSKLGRIFSLHKSKNTEEPASPPPSSGAPSKPEKRETYAQVLADAAEIQEKVQQPPFKLPDDTRILISQSQPGQGAATVVFDSVVAETASDKNLELLHKLIPAWVGEALWLPKMSSRTPVRIGFSVEPFDESHPEILQNKGRLLANPILRAHKAMSYALVSLKEGGHLKNADGPPEDYIELYCKDELVPSLMTLAMIRTRIWRNGGDVVLKYKFKSGVEYTK